MKPVMFKNRVNGEIFVCDDLRACDIIEGVEYLVVHRPDQDRHYKMRRDSLIKFTPVVQRREQDRAKI